MPKVVDYLTEDPPINGQKYALVSIVGPNMPQKTDTWGMKVRGVANTLEKAKEMSAKIIKSDSDYDIYTVEVGKFFPLRVEPHEISDVEYSNDKLNELMKKYLENKELANQEWKERKERMVKEATDKKNSSETPEHPFSVIFRIDTNEEYLQSLQTQLAEVKETLAKDKAVFKLFSKKEVVESYKHMTSTAKLGEKTVEFIKTLVSEEELESQTTELEPKNADSSESKDLELDTLNNKLETLKKEYNKIENKENNYLAILLSKEIASLEVQIETVTKTMTDKNLVNDYVNSKYKDSILNDLF